MKRTTFFITILLYLSSCSNIKKEENSSKLINFYINKGRVIQQVIINDSIKTYFIFDTGFGEKPFMDSVAFWTIFKPDSFNNIKANTRFNFGHVINLKEVKSNICFKLNDKKIKYTKYDIGKWPEIGNSKDSITGVYPISKTDSNTWFLNFEKNYIIINPTTIDTTDYEKFHIKWHSTFNTNKLMVSLPIQFKNEIGSLGSLNNYIIDTGNPFDIIISSGFKELEFLNKSNQKRTFQLRQNLWCNYSLPQIIINKSIKIDTIVVKHQLNQHYVSSDIIGLNFLKRFNLIFDLKNMFLYLKPIKHEAILTPGDIPAFTFPIYQGEMTKDGYIKILQTFKDGLFDKAGIIKGDIIKDINGVSALKIKQTPYFIKKELEKKTPLNIKIIRDFKELTIIINN